MEAPTAASEGVWIAGVDGCRGGFVCALREERTGELRFRLFESARALFASRPAPAVIGIDIPIGLLDAGPRGCDREARTALGPRRASVFPSPLRPALRARTRAEADRITRRADGRGVGAQAFAIYARVREVDAELRRSRALRRRVAEVHPELAFLRMNGGRPLESKHTPSGIAQRRRLLSAWVGRAELRAARGALLSREVADDDLLDALAVLWSAARIGRGLAQGFPEPAPRDRFGIPMQIRF
jgi:predicted RNase H-like nuclease